MLARSNRLREKTLFQQLFARGKRHFVEGIGLFSLPRKDARLVVAVTFKQQAFPRAVTRHWYKRRVLHWVREHMGKISPAQTMAVHFQRPLLKQDAAGLKERLERLFAIK